MSVRISRFACRRRLLLSLSSFAALAACGGGGETDLTSYLPNFAAPAPVDIGILTDDSFVIDPNVLVNLAGLLILPQYQNTPATIAWINNTFGESISGSATQDPLRTSGAAFAHATGLTGAGEVIAFSDQGISPTHESIIGRINVLSNGANPEHGTSVASVAIGNSASFIGTAPGATGIFGHWDDPGLTEVGQEALAQGAVAWNNSWGYEGLWLNATDFNFAFGGVSGQAYLTALQNYANFGVVVFAVDNVDNQAAGLMDGLPVMVNSLEAGWLAVANGVPTLTGTGDVSSVYLLSSPCYESARWCLVADGSWTAAEGPGSDYTEMTGSSFAAPQVAGALALLAEAFPALTPHELRIRLLASAEDDFFTADDTVELADGYFKPYSVIYGHGFLDIEAALNPIGPTAMSLAAGTQVSTDAPVLMTGTGFGDAVEMSLTGTNVAIRDVLNAQFAMPGQALTSGARPGSQAPKLLAKSLASNLAADRTAIPGVNDPFASFAAPSIRMADPEGETSATVLLPLGGSEAAGVAVSRTLGDETKVELGLKLARDSGTMMSLGGDSAATMASVTLGLTQTLGKTGFLSLSGEFGLTDLGGATALTQATTASFNAVKLSAGQSDVFAKGDRFSIGVGLPVAIASGTAVAELPVLREAAAMSFENVALELSPDDRQMDLEMTYLAPLGKNAEMTLSVIHSENFGNRAGVRDTSGAIAFSFKF